MEEKRKKCSHCKLLWPLSKFYPSRKTEDGRMIHCKLCCKETSQKHYERKKLEERRKYLEDALPFQAAGYFDLEDWEKDAEDTPKERERLRKLKELFGT